MQHFFVYLVQLIDLYTMVIYCEVHTKPNYKSRVMCLLPPAVMYHWSHLVWEKKKVCFLVNTQHYGAAPEKQFNNLSSDPQFREVRQIFWTCIQSPASLPPPVPALYCALGKGSYSSFLERESCCLPINNCNSAIFIWTRPQGTSQYIKKYLVSSLAKLSYLTGN